MRTSSFWIASLLLLAACGGEEPVAGADRPLSPASGQITFASDWSERLTGELRQGGSLTVHYSLDRLPQCRGTDNGAPAWDIVAHVRFAPGGQHLQGSLRALAAPGGTPPNSASSKPLTVTIPAGATAVEIWFHNFTGAGSSCSAWDSNYGKNYTFKVAPAANDPRCLDMQRWSTQRSDMPYQTKDHCLDYDVASQHDATYCEFYLSGLGEGYMAHYGIPNGWVEAYLHVGPQLGTVLSAGVWTGYKEKTSEKVGQRFTVGFKHSGDTWQTGTIHQRTGYMGDGSYHHEVLAMAFFIDVKRPTGEVVRLWQSRGGKNYSLTEALSPTPYTKYIPYGNIKYAVSGASVFDMKWRCGG